MGRRINDSYCVVANECNFWERVRKIIAPLLESELSFSTGTFLNNYDIKNRKLQPLLIRSIVGKRAKRTPDIKVETTNERQFKLTSEPTCQIKKFGGMFCVLGENALRNKRTVS